MKSISLLSMLASLSMILASTLAGADMFNPSPSPMASTASGQEAQCNQYCDALVDSGGHVLGLNGSKGWTVADDQWCADHGSATNPLIGVNPTPTSTVPPPAGQCGVTMINGDTDCSTTEQRLQHCQWHNGQVEQQCEAYERQKAVHPGEVLVLGLDIAGAATCATACATSASGMGGNSIMLAACRSAGMAASTTEFIQTLMQGGGIGSTLVQAGMSGVGVGMPLKSAIGFSTNGGPNSPDGMKSYFKGAHGNAGDNHDNNKRDRAACMSAVMLGMMAGTREAAIKSQESSAQDSCKNVLQYVSQSPTAGYALLGNTPSGSSGGGSTGGGSTGMTDSGSSGLQCVASGGSVSSCAGTSSTAPDIQALQSGGLAQHVAPAAAQLMASPYGAALSNGTGNAGQAIQGAGGGGGSPDAGNAVATAASAAQAHAKELSEGVDGTAVGGGGGGGDGGGGGEEQPNPMAALAALMNPQGQNQAPVGGTLNFKGQQQPVDIYHRNSEENIFQIISNRMQSVSRRMQ